MAKLTLNNITSGYGSNDLYNANNAAIEAAIENTLALDGTTPNSLQADLDMNGHAILNQLATSGNENFIWKGNWTASTAYSVNNLVYYSGSTYITTTAHTSSTSFNASYFTLLASQGATGAGTGDVVGPGSSTAGEIPTYSDTTGKVITTSGVTASGGQITLGGDPTSNLQAATKQYADGKTAKVVPSAANNVALLDASGNLVDSGSALSAGSIVQVQYYQTTSTYTHTLAATSATLLSPIAASITPTNTSNKILIIVNWTGGYSTNVTNVGLLLDRSGTLLRGVSPTPKEYNGVIAPITIPYQKTDASLSWSAILGGSFTYIDTPATTSALTYTLAAAQTASTSSTLYTNRTVYDSVALDGYERGVTTITLMEIT